ncbi:APC family permease [Nonomuraea soli]|uniref:Amino acid transporter n=1 Tax=Nonomuraea soli TaxID=1032476 RepID=A0A7W0CDE4_9ACTN|nr:APC family permease [Nonomuraea soli]MBA2889101.1 amino acid transporter [Nonomuraea soli]
MALRRGLRAFGTLLIVLSAITPASSVFIIAPGVIRQAGTGAFWSYVLAAVVGVFMAFVYAELSSAYPLTGGEYTIIGRTLGRLPGFMALVLVLVTQLLILAVIALGVGIYLGALLPGLHGPTIAAVTVLVSMALAVLDIKVNAVVTGIFLAVEMLALVVVTWLGLANVTRPFGDLLVSPVAADGSAVSFGMIAIATAVAIFSYNGYGSAVYFGEETHEPRRDIARVILWALVITVASELIPITAALLSATDLGGDVMLEFVAQRGGQTVTTLVSLGIALAIVNAVLAIMLLCARLVFSSARDATWTRGANRALSSVHPRFGTPWVATIAAGVVSAAFCFVPLQFLLVVTGTSLVVLYAALCVAVIAGRRNGSTSRGAYRMPLYPLAPVAGLAALGYVLYANAIDPVFGRPSLYVTAGLLAVAALLYATLIRRGWSIGDVSED